MKRILKVTAIALLGPFLGAVIGLIIAIFLLPRETGEVPAYVDGANGMLMFLCIVDGLLVSIPISVLLAIWSWRKSSKPRSAT
jgi:hypothetical protein